MNRPFIHGIDFEERLRTTLESFGCRIYHDQTYDQQYKLDFIVNGFRNVARLPEHIGLRITANKDDLARQREFLEIQRRSVVVPKAVYLEVDPEADIEQGAATLLYAALLTLAFSAAYRKCRIIGLRLSRGFTFEFFDLDEHIRRLQEAEKKHRAPRTVQVSEETLVGKIINFHKEKGYGFIQCVNRPNNVFFHIRNEVDEAVMARISAMDEAAAGWRQLDIPVTFREKVIGGSRGLKPAAFDVKLQVQREFSYADTGQEIF